jgi:hypothetical protein
MPKDQMEPVSPKIVVGFRDFSVFKQFRALKMPGCVWSMGSAEQVSASFGARPNDACLALAIFVFRIRVFPCAAADHYFFQLRCTRSDPD